MGKLLIIRVISAGSFQPESFKAEKNGLAESDGVNL